MADPRLVVHHVGGRGGGGAFPLPPNLSGDVHWVMYDADADASTSMEVDSATVLPLCVGAGPGRGVFNVMRDPHASSLLLLDPVYAGAYFFNTQYDYVLGTSIEPAARVELAIDGLDAARAGGRLSALPPDVLSLDTQGTEYDILQGAADLLEHDVVCVVTEVEFHPIYAGQKVFGDVSSLLAGLGFHFVRIEPKAEMSFFRTPVGQRGRGIQHCGDAIFLKDIEAVRCRPNAAFGLRKLALAAVTYGLVDYALAALAAARTIASVEPETPPVYWSFLDRFEAAAGAMPHLFPLTFADFHPLPNVPAGAAAPSGGGGPGGRPAAAVPVGLRARLKGVLPVGLRRRLIAVVQGYRQARRRVLQRLTAVFGRATALESVLEQAGFYEVSRVVRQKRIAQRGWCADNSRSAKR